jgi:hypothetical protein
MASCPGMSAYVTLPYTHAACCLRVLYQGCAGSIDACGRAPNIEWAMAFCPNNTMQLCVGAHAAASSGRAGASYGGAGWVGSFALAPNRLYTFVGFNAAPTVYPEGYVGRCRMAPHSCT